MNELQIKGKCCKEASYRLMNMSEERKNIILESIAVSLEEQMDSILKANKLDVIEAKKNKKLESFIDRLTLNKQRMQQIIGGVRQIIALKDPCNLVLDQWDKDGLHFEKVSVPIGVIGIIYEARPNVSVDAACLCLKAGNVCFLRGSKDTIYSNKAIVQAIKDGLIQASCSEHVIELVEDTTREGALSFMQLSEYLDLLIPRGSASLIKTALVHAQVPIIETGTGNCHVYVDRLADYEKAIAIILNAKCQRVSVCNACESILIHKDLVEKFLPLCVHELKEHGVTIYGDEWIATKEDVLCATDEDYGKEYLGYEVSIKLVNDVEEAIKHINQYSTHHSDVIVTEDEDIANKFLKQVDSAVVYHNVSSRFSDGEEFGFGAEIGISTQKTHARGPMGLTALTTYKYIVTGEKAIRI